MILKCKFIENTNNLFFEMVDENDTVVNTAQCEQKFLCEKLPHIFQEITKQHETFAKNIKLSILFDINKHITSYRILKSFISGLTI